MAGLSPWFGPMEFEPLVSWDSKLAMFKPLKSQSRPGNCVFNGFKQTKHGNLWSNRWRQVWNSSIFSGGSCWLEHMTKTRDDEDANGNNY